MDNPIKMDDLGVPLFLETPPSLWEKTMILIGIYFIHNSRGLIFFNGFLLTSRVTSICESSMVGQNQTYSPNPGETMVIYHGKDPRLAVSKVPPPMPPPQEIRP